MILRITPKCTQNNTQCTQHNNAQYNDTEHDPQDEDIQHTNAQYNKHNRQNNSVKILSVIMTRVIVAIAIPLSVFILNVVAPFNHHHTSFVEAGRPFTYYYFIPSYKTMNYFVI